MTFIYPVILTRRDDGSWEGEFPDLEMCRCEGRHLHEALEDAGAAYNWIDLELQEEDPVMPHVSDVEDLDTEGRPGGAQHYGALPFYGRLG